MGNALVCFEHGTWDSHHHVRAQYKPLLPPQQDMTRPLSHYFISSGHNSYLEGNQLTSKAGTSTIESGLRLGCRVIELDVYDGPNGEPICTHGGTLTSDLKFVDAVRAICKHSFHVSPYPVILTIENHAGVEQQATMAAHLHGVLGQHLFQPEPGQLDKDGEWLSPETLKHKVVIRMKVKDGETAPELAKLVYIRNTKIASYELNTGPKAPSSHSLPDSKLPEVPEFEGYKWVSSSGGAKPTGARQPISYTGATPAAAAAASGRNAKAEAELKSEMMLDAEMDDTLDETETKASVQQTQSTSAAGAAVEAAVEASSGAAGLPADLSSPHLSKVYEYASKHLLRCYPGGWRMINNTNLNPANAWSLGASLAALNWQLWDEPVWINQAFFSQQNYSGYVAKPSWMTTDVTAAGMPERTPRTLSVTVYSAHVHQGKQMSITKDDPYVELRVHGMPRDMQKVRTDHANDTGRLVVDKTFELNISFPELAVLVVFLKDVNIPHADEILGYVALPLATLAPGEYKLQLSEPYVCIENAKRPRDVWVKVKLGWADHAADVAAVQAVQASAEKHVVTQLTGPAQQESPVA